MSVFQTNLSIRALQGQGTRLASEVDHRSLFRPPGSLYNILCTVSAKRVGIRERQFYVYWIFIEILQSVFYLEPFFKQSQAKLNNNHQELITLLQQIYWLEFNA